MAANDFTHDLIVCCRSSQADLNFSAIRRIPYVEYSCRLRGGKLCRLFCGGTKCDDWKAAPYFDTPVKEGAGGKPF